MHEVQLQTFGLSGRYGQPAIMDRFHRHHEIELNYLETGSCTYLFGGRRTTVAAQQLALFWAAVPHQMIEVAPETSYHWLTVPLVYVLRWRLPEALAHRLLRGLPLIERDPCDAALDQGLFRRWQADLGSRTVERHTIVLLEVEARLRRLALALGPADQPLPERPPRLDDAGLTHVERMASCIAERYTEPLRAADIAGAAGLHPNYAMALFQQTFGTSFGDYLAHHRVAHAQRLLLTTDRPILDIALDAGFGSLSRFYVTFKRICGQAPRSYRAALRGAATGPLSPPHLGGTQEHH